jgi:hypothetical protein
MKISAVIGEEGHPGLQRGESERLPDGTPPACLIEPRPVERVDVDCGVRRRNLLGAGAHTRGVAAVQAVTVVAGTLSNKDRSAG